MSKKPVNDTSVRIPAHAHDILCAENERIRVATKKKPGIGTLAGVYIERGELFKEMVTAQKATLAREKAYLELIRRFCGDSGDKDGCQIQSPNHDCAKLCVLGRITAGYDTKGVTKAKELLAKAQPLL